MILVLTAFGWVLLVLSAARWGSGEHLDDAPDGTRCAQTTWPHERIDA